MKVKHLFALLPAVAGVSAQAHASANLSGMISSAVVRTSSAISPQFLPILPCAPSPENATLMLVLFGAAGLFAGYQLRRMKHTGTATATTTTL